ncbi:unnamed protein product [Prorocentrum cordatum]|uniref:GPI ethanolamine phosphate transferase 1 n=1 Tax=Prorocentrum cordatum TaxID=2364126 RepID=A0ABN9TU35_9DINO|nr:unnamed protein product [Polarella glacialis]
MVTRASTPISRISRRPRLLRSTIACLVYARVLLRQRRWLLLFGVSVLLVGMRSRFMHFFTIALICVNVAVVPHVLSYVLIVVRTFSLKALISVNKVVLQRLPCTLLVPVLLFFLKTMNYMIAEVIPPLVLFFLMPTSRLTALIYMIVVAPLPPSAFLGMHEPPPCLTETLCMTLMAIPPVLNYPLVLVPSVFLTALLCTLASITPNSIISRTLTMSARSRRPPSTSCSCLRLPAAAAPHP